MGDMQTSSLTNHLPDSAFNACVEAKARVRRVMSKELLGLMTVGESWNFSHHPWRSHSIVFDVSLFVSFSFLRFCIQFVRGTSPTLAKPNVRGNEIQILVDVLYVDSYFLVQKHSFPRKHASSEGKDTYRPRLAIEKRKPQIMTTTINSEKKHF